MAAARSGQLVTGAHNKKHHCKQHAKERSCAYTFGGNPPIDVTDETEKISTVGGIFTLVKQKMPAIVAKTDFCHTGVQNLYDLQQCRFRDGVVSKLKTLGTCCIDHAFSPDGELMCLELESKVLQMLRVADSSLSRWAL